MPRFPGPRLPGRRPRAEMPLVQLIPNAVTLIAIGAGLTAVRAAIHGNVHLAVGLIVLAAVLDVVDGRLARMLNSESAIGAELDSLADFFNFGVVPALVLYLWGLQDESDVGWAAVLVYAVCCALRLARFNVGVKSEAGNDPAFFTGVPAPMGALLVMLPIYVSAAWPDPIRFHGIAVSLYMVLIGALLVSTLPTWSTKKMTIYADHARLALAGGAVIAAALYAFPWVTLVVMVLTYLASLPFALRAYRRRITLPNPSEENPDEA